MEAGLVVEKRGLIARRGFEAGTLASIVAGILIEGLLAGIAVDGLEWAFSAVGLSIMAALVAIGVAAYAGYSSWARRARFLMRYVSPLALVLASAAVAGAALGYLGVVEAGGLIVSAYLVELAVGLKLASDFREVSPLYAQLFLVGVGVFVLSLPLVLVNPRLALVPLAGNTVKIIGLAGLYLERARA